ncbi:MAG: hypothetical protein UY32_C0024G0007 [Candidatus Jorgensenbacteria bacterium GW2011_GWC1_48_8]|uniref:Uncharacterized protein n=1 Tax=Candidatus Jorgensenbacteria bacterium GW2011_GWC1_48_8 TaxID=1618666 RepID=A0A0G1UWJ9_9BACT|nr:MAG: hypothetical protein UY32_C0024G0007 [Candidatus Jorgensenbacteria bacterium GW2011_GWC1_48_8]
MRAGKDKALVKLKGGREEVGAIAKGRGELVLDREDVEEGVEDAGRLVGDDLAGIGRDEDVFVDPDRNKTKETFGFATFYLVGDFSLRSSDELDLGLAWFWCGAWLEAGRGGSRWGGGDGIKYPTPEHVGDGGVGENGNGLDARGGGDGQLVGVGIN